MWTGRTPNLKYLRVFSSKAWAYIPREKRGKWDAKAKELMFTGYDENIKGYRLIDPETRKITISRDVIFREECQNGMREEESKDVSNYELTGRDPIE